jgi:hypothetical protein
MEAAEKMEQRAEKLGVTRPLSGFPLTKLATWHQMQVCRRSYSNRSICRSKLQSVRIDFFNHKITMLHGSKIYQMITIRFTYPQIFVSLLTENKFHI